MGKALKKNQTSVRDSSGIRPSLMGSEGSGKTCFFAGLAWLGSAAQRGDFGVIGRNKESQAFLNDLRDTLARNELPQSTRKTDDLALDVLYKNARIGIDIENFAGEEFRAVGTELQCDSPLYSRFLESKYLILFLDIANDIDCDAPAGAVRLDAVLNLLSTEAFNSGSRKLAIVLTKSDLRGFVGPEATSSVARDYINAHKPGLLAKIENLHYEKEFFFLAPIGHSSLADGRPPAPFGFENLFDWLVGDMRDELLHSWIERHRIPLIVSTFFLVFAITIGIGFLFLRHHSHKILSNDSATFKEQIRALKFAPQKDKDAFIDIKIDTIHEALSSVDSLSALSDIQQRVDQWAKFIGAGEVEKRLGGLRKELSEKREDLYIKSIDSLANQESIDKCRKVIADYRFDASIAHSRQSEVNAIEKKMEDLERENLHSRIRGTVVKSGISESLKSRCDLIVEIKPKLPDDIIKEADRAVAIGRLFLSDSPYHIEIKTAKGLHSAHHTRLTFSNLGPSSTQLIETDLVDSRNPQWNKKGSIRWRPGDRTQIVWYWKSPVPFTIATEIGTRVFDDPWTSLLDMLGGVELSPITGAGHARLDGNIPNAVIFCEEFPNPQEDIRLFKKYLVPGTYWQD